ncbi:MAG: hypothetical protein GSR86_06955 [Desulfurococcales archaeon]|nr:hypothetical protein [Desulfurococcales archaeon]
MANIYLAPPHSYAAPMRRGLERLGFKVVTTTPPEAASLVSRSRGLTGLIPIALLDNLRHCPGPMVYSLGETMSVVIVSKEPLSLRDCRVIAVSGESRTSIIYLKLVSTRLGLGARILQHPSTSTKDLLGSGECALLLGDEALRARTRYYIVEDLGALVKRVLGINPVYAVTATRGRCNKLLEEYKPVPSDTDPIETSKRTGIPLEDAVKYHNTIKLDYNKEALEKALWILKNSTV